MSRLLEQWLAIEKDRIVREADRERAAAEAELAERLGELRESLISELEEKRRVLAIEAERDKHGAERLLTSHVYLDVLADASDARPPVCTRKLRRRPNDPAGPPTDKRRRASPSAFLLHFAMIYSYTCTRIF